MAGKMKKRTLYGGPATAPYNPLRKGKQPTKKAMPAPAKKAVSPTSRPSTTRTGKPSTKKAASPFKRSR